MVVMGRIVAPYGILGWLKVQPHTENVDSLFDYENWWLGRDSVWNEYSVEEAKVHGKTLLVKLDKINDRDSALVFKGKQVAVPRELLPPTEENEYYWSDLIGLEVTNKESICMGSIVDVFETGANDVLVVKGDKERLIPFVAQVILQVDLESKTMIVDWDADF